MYELAINKIHTGALLSVENLFKARRALNDTTSSVSGLIAKALDVLVAGVPLTEKELAFCEEYAQHELDWRYERRRAMAAGEKNPKRGEKYAKLNIPKYIP